MLLALTKYDNIVIYDPYATENGFAAHIKTKLCNLSYKGDILSFSVPDTFVSQAKIIEQLEEYGLLPKQVLSEIKKLL
jgi:deoxyxylulose-5-phosphate synthase